MVFISYLVYTYTVALVGFDELFGKMLCIQNNRWRHSANDGFHQVLLHHCRLDKPCQSPLLEHLC